MADEQYVVMTVERPTCKTKQKIHVTAITGVAQGGGHLTPCIRCTNRFKVAISDKIIRGPFPV